MQQNGNHWDLVLAAEYEKDYFRKLEGLLEEE